jgi:copper oxidase (laccase) domain-containing protein
VKLSRAAIPAQARDGLAIAFPGPARASRRGPGEPTALLSFAVHGDMKFGDPKCAANRARFLEGNGIDPRDARGLELSHTRNILFPTRGDDVAALARALGAAGTGAGSGGADGLLMGDAELAATVTVADCMPIWILDRDTGTFGVLHSGWRGTGILARAVEALGDRWGSRPSSISVILGPAVGPCCYAVSEERAMEFAAEFGEGSVTRRGGSWALDLRSANLSLAQRAGVGHVLSIEACTSCDERLGSFRRQGAGSFTRMLAACGRSPRAPDIIALDAKGEGRRG